MGSQRRVLSVRAKLDGLADALVVSAPANVRYLTNLDGVFDGEPASLAILVPGGQWIVTDSRYIEAVRGGLVGSEWQMAPVSLDLAKSAAALLNVPGISRVALETTLEHRSWRRLEGVLDADVVEADGWVEDVRSAKEPFEIGRIEAAQELTDRAFDHLLGVIRAGLSEQEIAIELEFFMRRNGSEGVAFSSIVASGPNSALPHAAVSPRTLRDGDFVVLDFGARIDGYCADMTRTVVIGSASERHREIYDTVFAANHAGIEAVRPGLPGREIDLAARSVISAAGFAENFGHGLGHGVGLEVHERPGVGARSEAPVPLGSVITIEPGVYVPEFGGVRIEDLVVVEEAGARVLTRSTKELIEL
jgi:Xaa-Pro aminopeptidase